MVTVMVMVFQVFAEFGGCHHKDPVIHERSWRIGWIYGPCPWSPGGNRNAAPIDYILAPSPSLSSIGFGRCHQ